MHGSTSFRWLSGHTLAGCAAALFCLALGAPASAEEPAPPSEPPISSTEPHIALILPTLAHGSLAAAAEAVRAGALAGEATEGSGDTPKLRLYPTGEKDDDTLTAYHDAVAAGAIGVIGPLTRSAITKLATDKLGIPVLALNSIGDGKSTANLFSLGLSIEAETRQVARAMKHDGHRHPLIIEADGPMARRMRDAFLDEWKQQQGETPELLTLSTEHDGLAKLKDYAARLHADAVFLAADSKKARLVRSVIGSERATYATSQAWDGSFDKSAGDNLDLAGVRFVDMPWTLDPWSADVSPYARPSKPLSADLERLYALGIDAYRLSLLLLVSSPGAAIDMQGVTGTLHLSESRQFSRELMTGVIGDPPRTPKPKPTEPPSDDATGNTSAPMTTTPTTPPTATATPAPAQ